eukprot:TRINITY_DN6686_c0_g1_i1.p1 TRINITY_DN6686_c0_g1~~TRINITY_DN6686_c0_g1_i1.p1  ORF type:complete len:323 (+),score=28.97 TRINITY_DN6686_c0_g1_i1:129-971(+)
MFLISPEGKLKSMQINMNDVGRSVEEALRLLDAFRYVAEHGVVCPADWKPGEKAMSASQEGLLDWAGDEAREQKQDDALPQITSREQYNEVTNSDDPVVVDYMASWCGKCRMIAPYVEDLSKKYPDISFYKVDTSKPEFEGLTKELGIEALPAFRFYRRGREAVEQVSGYKKKPLGEAVDKLSKAVLPDEAQMPRACAVAYAHQDSFRLYHRFRQRSVTICFRLSCPPAGRPVHTQRRYWQVCYVCLDMIALLCVARQSTGTCNRQFLYLWPSTVTKLVT